MSKKTSPSMDSWLKEAKAHESAPKIGMYLTHNGIVRESAKAKVRQGAAASLPATVRPVAVVTRARRPVPAARSVPVSKAARCLWPVVSPSVASTTSLQSP